jgi:hypothetical protein
VVTTAIDLKRQPILTAMNSEAGILSGPILLKPPVSATPVTTYTAVTAPTPPYGFTRVPIFSDSVVFIGFIHNRPGV